MRVRYDFILGRTIPLNTVVYPALFTLTVLTCLALFWAFICHNIKEFYLFLFFYSTATRNRASEMFGTGIVLVSLQREDLNAPVQSVKSQRGRGERRKDWRRARSLRGLKSQLSLCVWCTWLTLILPERESGRGERNWHWVEERNE